MPIVYNDVIQGTTEWAEMRGGIPTASQFHRIVTPKGNVSKSAEMYLFELLAERITGELTVGYTSHWMDRGSELEASAVEFYGFMKDVDTIKCGFITNDSGTIGCSPDRLVEDRGLLEIKVPKASTQVMYLLKEGSAYDEHVIQAQGQLWVAEREFNDLLSYHPLLPPALHRVHRDEAFITLLASALTTFSLELERLTDLCEERGWMEEYGRRRRQARSEQNQLIDALRDSLREMKGA